MFIKTNEAGIEKNKEVYEKFKKIYGDMLKLDETEYYLIVGAFGGTQGRTNQEVIKRMKEIFDVKNLDI
ncbi:MAG TPA: hypothetical protein VJ892_03925 [Candidatus Absconditabacterales bacterium]|nr:hypothetical protein [Candidatus Absconditabacterales bacterium]